jgi:hypothetical protein
LDQVKEDGSIEVYLSFTDYLITHERYPETIVSGLSEIGGLFAALQISLILAYMNEYRFNRKLNMRQKL